MTIDNESCLLDILDTAGQDDYSAMRDSYMRSGQGFLIVFSITSKPSFMETATFHDQILRVKDANAVPMVLVGNKCDLEENRAVTKEEAEAKAADWKIPFKEASAKSRINVDESFFDLVREIKKSINPDDKKKKKKKCPIL